MGAIEDTRGLAAGDRSSRVQAAQTDLAHTVVGQFVLDQLLESRTPNTLSGFRREDGNGLRPRDRIERVRDEMGQKSAPIL